MRVIKTLLLIGLSFQNCAGQTPQTPIQPNNSNNQQNQQTLSTNNSQSQPQSAFTAPNLLQGYEFGSFSPFSNKLEQVLQPSPQVQAFSTSNRLQLPKINIRTKIRIDIEYQKTNLVELEKKLYDRISKIVINKPKTKIVIDISGRVAILNGVVTSDEDLFLIQGLISLEPGIDKIVDKLTVLSGGKNGQ